MNSDSFPTRDSPTALCLGTVVVGRTKVECYVLDGGDRIIGLLGAVQCIAGSDHKVKENPATAGLYRLIEQDLILNEVRTFLHPESQAVTTGITAKGFLNICRTFLVTLAERKVITRDQRDMATRCAALLDCCADIGLVALIDDTTGYLQIG